MVHSLDVEVFTPILPNSVAASASVFILHISTFHSPLPPRQNLYNGNIITTLHTTTTHFVLELRPHSTSLWKQDIFYRTVDIYKNMYTINLPSNFAKNVN